MCGRYRLTNAASLLHRLFGLEKDTALHEGELAPSAGGVVVARGSDGLLKAVPMRWGLEPGWMRDLPARPIFNARSETVEDKPMFREAFAKRRALVPATEFFEWQGEPGAKTRYRFRRADGEPMLFAGLWEKRRDDTGEWRLTYTVITCAANADVAEYHDRMPVILMPDQWNDWLDPHTPAGRLKEMLQPVPDGFLIAEKG